ncbi:hypothetical protein KM043_007609 [Ampulex compressa]|nr:hypothetical protein KM043_007609 [Ampulex compressa]
MPPKREKKDKDEDKGKKESGHDKKKKKKVLPKGEGMGGTIGITDKIVKPCPPRTKKSSCSILKCTPTPVYYVPVICCQEYCCTPVVCMQRPC